MPVIPHPNVDLAPLHTMGLAATARWFVEVNTEAELQQAIKFAREQGLPLLPIGGGSNLLPAEMVEAVVCQVNIRGIHRVGEVTQADEEAKVEVLVGAGENWDKFVAVSLESGWYGLESLSLIPGNVGAAPIQNIGAYGVELKHFLNSVTVVDLATGQSRELSAQDCRLGYRDSIFKHELKGQVIITAIRLQLPIVPNPVLEYPGLRQEVAQFNAYEVTPELVRKAVIQLRSAKLPDPDVIANSGSFFKNLFVSDDKLEQLKQAYPDLVCYREGDQNKIPAAWLIDKLGWKGKTQGNVGVHENQALVLVNKGTATREELLAFASEISADVKAHFGLALEVEPATLD